MKHDEAHLQSLEPGRSSHTLSARLEVLLRWKWVVLGPLLLGPAIALAATLYQKPLYRASAQVLLSDENLAASLNGLADLSAGLDPVSFAQTQADLARVPAVARRTLDAAGIHNRTVLDFLKTSSVSTSTHADLLAFDVTDPDPGLSMRLATEYAQQFVAFRSRLESAAFHRAIDGIGQRLQHLGAAGASGSPLYVDLAAKRRQLIAMESLQTPGAVLAQSADSASNIRLRPVREALFGGVLGLVIGVALAFLMNAVDRRVRTSEEIEERLGLPLLARLPSPLRDVQKGTPSILRGPADPYAESIRALRVRLDLAGPRVETRSIMVTSATQREGKSTTVANLAVALAQAGRRVVLCDLNARRPAIDRFFEVPAGLIDVTLGRVELEDALSVVAVAGAPNGAPQDAVGGSRSNSSRGVLEVLTLGRVPPDPAEFVESARVATIMETLRARADVVLVDAPPLLDVGDVLTLSGKVDALLVVTRLGIITRSLLSEMRRVLASCPAPALGFVLTGASVGDVYRRYGYRPQEAPAESEFRRATALMPKQGEIGG